MFASFLQRAAEAVDNNVRVKCGEVHTLAPLQCFVLLSHTQAFTAIKRHNPGSHKPPKRSTPPPVITLHDVQACFQPQPHMQTGESCGKTLDKKHANNRKLHVSTPCNTTIPPTDMAACNPNMLACMTYISERNLHAHNHMMTNDACMLTSLQRPT